MGRARKIKVGKTVGAACLVAAFVVGSMSAATAEGKTPVKAIYIPLADHYAGVVAYEKYGDQMEYADYQIEKMKSWPLLRAKFMSGEVDMAFIICPQAMDMFRESPTFRWVSLMHRDGNALAINDLLNVEVRLPEARIDRNPDTKVAEAFVRAKEKLGRPTEVGVPHLQATHTVVLYKYLKDNGLTLGLDSAAGNDVVAIEVPPAQSPAFLKKNNSRAIPASFEQSLPWADVVETQNFGHVAWYSKDVMPWPNGHVECIVIATDNAIQNKREALREVIRYIHQAGVDIEDTRATIGENSSGDEHSAAVAELVEMIQAHIPEHNTNGIIQSLRLDLNVINFKNLNLDKDGLRMIMDLAVEGGILKDSINIEDFADSSFATGITIRD